MVILVNPHQFKWLSSEECDKWRKDCDIEEIPGTLSLATILPEMLSLQSW